MICKSGLGSGLVKSGIRTGLVKSGIGTGLVKSGVPTHTPRLHGGYESLKGGKTSEAMEDFTGGVTESIDLSQDTEGLFTKIKKNAGRSSLMSCSIKATTREDMEAKLESGNDSVMMM